MSSSGQTIVLNSSDGVDISVGKWCCHVNSYASTLTKLVQDKETATRSVLIKNLLEDLGDTGEPIPILNVSLHTYGVFDPTDAHPVFRSMKLY